jgi:hypothetical protein
MMNQSYYYQLKSKMANQRGTAHDDQHKTQISIVRVRCLWSSLRCSSDMMSRSVLLATFGQNHVHSNGFAPYMNVSGSGSGVRCAKLARPIIQHLIYPFTCHAQPQGSRIAFCFGILRAHIRLEKDVSLRIMPFET